MLKHQSRGDKVPGYGGEKSHEANVQAERMFTAFISEPQCSGYLTDVPGGEVVRC